VAFNLREMALPKQAYAATCFGTVSRFGTVIVLTMWIPRLYPTTLIPAQDPIRTDDLYGVSLYCSFVELEL